MTTTKWKDWGSFELKTQHLVVSDPAYMPGTWCMGVLEPCKKGTWVVALQYGDFSEDIDGKHHEDWRNMCIRVRHTDYEFDDFPPFDDAEKELDMKIGIDSGRCGFFDGAFYRNQETVPEQYHDGKYGEDRWSNLCLDGIMNEERGTVLPFGVISESGFGDGRAGLYFGRNDQGLIVSAELVFIDED